VFLILDNLRGRHGKKVSAWLEANRDAIKVYFLLPYALEYNPDEYLNADLKRKIRSKIPTWSNDDLTGQIRSFMKTLRKPSYPFKQYFKHPSVSCAVNVTV